MWFEAQKIAQPDGRPTPEFLQYLQNSLGIRLVEVADASEIPVPPEPNTFYFVRA
jgi:hypothetical protein